MISAYKRGTIIDLDDVFFPEQEYFLVVPPAFYKAAKKYYSNSNIRIIKAKKLPTKERNHEV